MLSSLSPWTWALVLAVGFCACSYYLASAKNRRHHLPLPPGPRPFPIIGNLLDLPPADTPEFQHWLEHKDRYGPVSCVSVMGKMLVIIHGRSAADEILGKLAAKTSGRPSSVFAGELCGYEALLPFQGYSGTFVRSRGLLHRELGTKALSAQFQGTQEVEAGRLLVRALNRPKDWREHFKTSAAATIVKTTYGYSIDSKETDILVTLIDKRLEEFSRAATPMTWMVDIFPFLRHIPEGFPGAGFQKTARIWGEAIHEAAWLPYRFVQRQMAHGTNRESYVSKMINKFDAEGSGGSDGQGGMSKQDEKDLVWAAVSLYGAATDTTVHTLTAFTLAMILFPQVQRRAQEEIDTVVGKERLPTFEDRDRLPYVNALVKEVMRWWPMVPMGLPHATEDEVEYDGMRIPKGAYLLPAVWWFLKDPTVYADPQAFDPTRFLAPRDEPDPKPDVFGYGRRLCPGRFFADAGLFITIVRSLAAFEMSKAVLDDGTEVDVNVRPKPGIICFPTHFDFKIVPRSPEHAELIRQFEQQHPWEAGDAQLL